MMTVMLAMTAVLARRAMIVATLALWAGPAAAQTAPHETATIQGSTLWLDLTPPANTGKPRLFVPPPVVPPPSGCAAALDCRVRIIGAVQRNGAIELNATAFKW